MDWPTVLFDEDYPVYVARRLRECRLPRVRILADDFRPGADDRAAIEFAAAHDAVLVTQNHGAADALGLHVRDRRLHQSTCVAVLIVPRDDNSDRLVARTILLIALWVLHREATLSWAQIAGYLRHLADDLRTER